MKGDKGSEEEEEAGAVLFGNDLVLSLSSSCFSGPEACAYLPCHRLSRFTYLLPCS